MRDITAENQVSPQGIGMCGQELEEYLLELFGGERVVTKAQFMRVMRIGYFTLRDMTACGRAPKMIPVGVGSGEGRYFLRDIARWVEQCHTDPAFQGRESKRGRGRPRKDGQDTPVAPVMAVA